MYLHRFLTLLAVFYMGLMTQLPLVGAPPEINFLSPNFGPVDGGTTVTILGEGFTGATAVNFGTTPATSFTVNSDVMITALSPPVFLSTVTVSVTTPSGTSTIGASSYYAYQGNWMAYVINGNGAITPIDTSNNTAGTPFACGPVPQGIVITPDGTKIYVTNLQANTVTPIKATGAGTPITVGSFPRGIAMAPNGTTVYVGNGGGNSVTPINVATDSAGAAIGVGSFPYDLAITPDGTTAYVLNSGDNNVTPITLATNTTGMTIAVGNTPHAISITPDGTKAYIVNTGNANVSPLTISSSFVGPTIPVGSTPQAIEITPIGSPITAYVVNSTGANTVTPINTTTNTPGTPIAVGDGPFGIAITPDGKTAYVVNASAGTVTPISIPSNLPGNAIPVGPTPAKIAISPDPAPIAFFIAHVAPPGSATFFDASHSVSSVGTIAQYEWNFGDGSLPFTTTSPTAAHFYALSGNYNVTLTVTNSNGTSTSQVFTGHTMSVNGGPSATTSQAITVPPAPPPAPTITNISPKHGPVVGGTNVTITGTNFTQVSEVRFGAILSNDFTVNSDTSITATSPPGVETVDVSVTTNAGTSPFTINDQFTYFYSIPSITGLSPSYGPAAGGTTVTITGVNFTGAVSVLFGTATAVFTVNSDTQLTATSPAGTGSVPVSVVTPAGIIPLNPKHFFTYLPLPAITSINPTSGSVNGGTVVEIIGTGFTGVTEVRFGPWQASSFTFNSDTSITAVSPPGTGIVDVSMTTPNGTSPFTPADLFTYIPEASSPLPTITAISPNSGPTTGGTVVMISGISFTGTTEVRFGPWLASQFTINNDTSITATSPPGTGTVDVSVTTPNGTSPFTPSDLYTYVPSPIILAPAITNISPSSGPTTGETSVTITGSRFTGTNLVLFGSVPALFVVVNDNSITAVSPPGTAGTVDITVTKPSGTSPLTSADRFTYIAVPPIVPPAPPSHFNAKIIKKKSCHHSEYVIELKWHPSPDPTVAGYRLYRDEKLIAEFAADGPFHYRDKHVKEHKQYTYKLIAFTANNLTSKPLVLRAPKHVD